jgi:hypothetical protein
MSQHRPLTARTRGMALPSSGRQLASREQHATHLAAGEPDEEEYANEERDEHLARASQASRQGRFRCAWPPRRAWHARNLVKKVEGAPRHAASGLQQRIEHPRPCRHCVAGVRAPRIGTRCAARTSLHISIPVADSVAILHYSRNPANAPESLEEFQDRFGFVAALCLVKNSIIFGGIFGGSCVTSTESRATT